MALGETRLLVLGTHILFGFQLRAVFEDAFGELPLDTRQVDCIGQTLLALTIGLLVAPAMQHLISYDGEDTQGIVRAASRYAFAALLPLGVSLGIGFFIVADHLFGRTIALTSGFVFCGLAGFAWYAFPLVVKRFVGGPPRMRKERGRTSIETKIEQMLTEARVIIPGAQALLGFQFTVILTHAFGNLSQASRLLHVAALCCVALSMMVLMTPAALHRISFGGENSARFYAMSSRLTVAAGVPLALGISGDLYVAIAEASGSMAWGVVLAAVALLCLFTLWYVVPFSIRRQRARQRRPAYAEAYRPPA